MKFQFPQRLDPFLPLSIPNYRARRSTLKKIPSRLKFGGRQSSLKPDRCGGSSARVNQNGEMSGIHLEKVSGGREGLETPRESYLVQAEWMKSGSIVARLRACAFYIEPDLRFQTGFHSLFSESFVLLKRG